MKIKAAVVFSTGKDFTLEEVELAEPKADEVLIRIVASGICHTDALVREMGVTPLPAVLGHEGAGIVEKLGANVNNLVIGDHVVLSFASCGCCENCLTGHPAYCFRFFELNMAGMMEDHSHRLYFHDQELSTFFGQSSFATYSIVNARNVVKVDPDIDLALLGPLGCGIQTGAGAVLNVLKPETGSMLVVYGTGAVGLSAIMAAKIAGCEQIIAVDIHASRLALAKELGATIALNSKQGDVVEKIKKISNGGVHYAVETTGVPTVVLQGIQALRPLGKIANVAAMTEIAIPFAEIVGQGKTIIGVIEGDSVPHSFIPELISYYKKGQFPFDKLVQFYQFENINDAFAANQNGSVIKPILKIEPSRAGN